MEEAKEIWKPIKGYEGSYEVSNLERIRSYPKQGNHYMGLILKQIIHEDGYLVVSLHKGKYRKQYKVHRIIAAAFIINPKHKQEVNHKNGIKTDNRIINLEWATKKENAEHASKTGLLNPLSGVNHKASRRIGRFLNGRLISSYGFIKKVEKDNFSYSAVRHALVDSHKSGGFYWKYLDEKAA